MQSYQPQIHDDQNQNSSLDSNFGPSMLKDDRKTQSKQPLISFKYHPGFMCFFEDYVKRQDYTYFQCFQKVFQSHHEMMKIRNPIEKIMMNKNLGKTQIINQLMLRADKGKNFAYYVKKQNGELQCNAIIHEDKRIQKIQKLKDELKRLEKIKEKVIIQKKKEFQNKEIQRSKELEKEAMNLMNQKQRRAHLVKKIQEQAENKRKLKSLSGQSQSSDCEIM